MARYWQANGVKLLTEAPTTPLVEEQLKKFTPASIHLDKVEDFDVTQTLSAIGVQDGKQVLGADFGGDKGIVRLFEVRLGKLVAVSGYSDDIQGNDGAGYTDTITKAAQYAQTRGIPFGISWGGPLDGSKLLFHPKAKTFYEEMNSRYGGDFTKISPSVKAVLNDGPAGLISGAVEAFRQFGATTVLLIINGSGIGLGVLKDGAIWSTEAGHVEGVAALNSYHQTEPCGVFDATYTCLERLGANKAGIEAQWEAKTGSYMHARDIEDKYKEGNSLAAELYEHSANVVAHIIEGSAQALDINFTDTTTAVVGHGGAFKFPYYGDRVAQLLQQAHKRPVRLIMTKDYTQDSSNACLDGAAISALLAK